MIKKYRLQRNFLILTFQMIQLLNKERERIAKSDIVLMSKLFNEGKKCGI